MALERESILAFAKRAFSLFERMEGPARQAMDVQKGYELAEAARSYGLTNQRQISVFMASAWVYGPNFVSVIPGLAEILIFHPRAKQNFCEGY